jgi:ribosome-binding factor A
MATGRRVSKVAELIRREVSQMLLHEIKDERVGAGMISVTNVDVSGDLQHATVFVSIYGSEEAQAETMEGLGSAAGYIRRELGKRVRLRRSPEIISKEDHSLERGMGMISLLNKIGAARQPEIEEDSVSSLDADV